MSRSGRLAWLCSPIVVIALVAACGSDKKDSTSSSGDTSTTVGGSSPTTAAAATPKGDIVVGGVVANSIFPGSDVGTKARFARANKEGGVNGRQVVLKEVIDDGLDRNKDLDAVKKLVEQDKVVAVLPVMTATFAGNDYLKQQQIPYFGWLINPEHCGSPVAFSTIGCVFSAATKVGNEPDIQKNMFPDKSMKGKTIAIIGTEDASAKSSVVTRTKIYEQNGAKVVYGKNPIPAPPTVVSDFSPFVNEIMKSNSGKPPDLVLPLTSSSSLFGFIKGLQAAKYPGIILEESVYDPKAAPLLNGIYVGVYGAAFEEDSAPIKQMKADITAFDPNAALSLGTAYSYWSADIFLKMAAAAGDDVTAAGIIKVGNNNFAYDAKGGLEGLKWPESHLSGPPCLSIVKGNGKGYDVVVPYTCVPLVDQPK
jgi:branched-chain amino acid transport system substrate-binding protein